MREYPDGMAACNPSLHKKIIRKFVSALSTKASARLFFRRNAARRFKTRDICGCPIARLVQCKMKTKEVGFDPHALNQSGVPKWAMVFGRRVDDEPGKTITGARCLELLDAKP